MTAAQIPPAETLSEAIEAFEAYELQPGDPRWSYYVEEVRTYLNGQHPLDRIERQLAREARKPPARRACPKILISGHKGTGKSTELQRLAEQLSDRFEVLSLQMSDYLNQDDCDARDVLFVVAGQLVERLAEYQGLAKLSKDPEAKAALQMFGPKLPGVSLHEEAIDFKLLGQLSGRLKFDRKLRNDIRRIALEQPEDLAALVDRPVSLLAGLVERPVLLVLDELDRIQARTEGYLDLFSTDFPLLTRPKVAAIYTISMEVFFNEGYAAVQNHAGEHGFVLGQIKLWKDRERQQRYEPGWAVMKRFVKRRARLKLFDPGALDKAIGLSGGSFRQLRLLLHHALDHAEWAGRDQVMDEDIAAAAKDLRAGLIRTFGAHRYVRALHRIHEQHLIQPDDLKFLPTLTVMEYENDNPWFDTNPLIEPHVRRTWQELSSE